MQIDNVYGKWRILRKIGEGGFSEVYLVEEILDPENKAALKIFKRKVSNEIFLREARNLKTLKHPNIVELIDYGVQPKPYIVMELMETNLKDYIEEHPLSFEEAINIWLQIADAINYAHSKGIIHQDIKPENILIKGNQFKIGDFGISEIIKEKIREASTETLSLGATALAEPKIFGTIYWSAPEQLKGIIDKRNDIYSLGKLLHYLVTNGGILPDRVTLHKMTMYNYPIEIKVAIIESLKPLNERLNSVLDQIVMVKKCIMKICVGKKEYDKAEKIVKEILEIKPNDPYFTAYLGYIYHCQEKYEKAIELYKKALELDPNNPITWNNLGLMYQNLHLFEKAEKAYRKAIELDPNSSTSWNNLASVLYDMGRFEEALNAIKKALKLNPEDVEVWRTYGAILGGLNRNNEAVKAFRRAIELDPKHVETWNCLAATYHIMGKIDEAIDAYNRALELRSNDENALLGLGYLYHEIGRSDEAIRMLRKVLEINPNNVNALVGLGIVLQETGKVIESINYFRRAIELNPYDAIAWFRLGISLQKLGRIYEAKQAFRKAKELAPELEIPHEYLR